jgi:hypothetical protein
MSLNIFKKQVKYCFLNVEDEELTLLRKKQMRQRNIQKVDKNKRVQDNLKYFELENKYKKVSKNVVKVIKSKI